MTETTIKTRACTQSQLFIFYKTIKTGFNMLGDAAISMMCKSV